MRTIQILLGLMVVSAASAALAETAPPFNHDPFGDGDFVDAPLVLDVAYPTQGRAEVGVLFSSTLIDKYTSHVGGTLDVQYHFTPTLGVGLGLSFLHGALTTIVTDPLGILGNKVQKCISDGGTACNLTPNVPDYEQVTGSIDAVFVWSPLYGKINVVSELDMSLQAYTLVGAGFNGTRQVEAVRDAAALEGYRLENGGIGAGGLFSNGKAHGTLGAGLKIFMVDWMALRGEVRGIGWVDEFAFGNDGVESKYISWRYLAEVGATFVIF